MSEEEATSSPDINRRLESMIRLGTVLAVDCDAACVRVQSGELQSDWLPWFERRAGTTIDWDPPTVGEQCMVLSPSGDPACGLVLVGIFSGAARPPSTSPDERARKYPDESLFVYNHKTGHLSIRGIRTFEIQASESGRIDCPQVTFTGKVTVEDLLSYLNGVRGKGGGSGNSITGEFTHTEGTLSSNGIVLHTHDHIAGVGAPT